MNKVDELRKKQADALERMEAIIGGAEGRDLTAEEETEYNSLDAGLDKTKADIARLEKLEDEKRELAKPKRVIPMHKGTVEDPKEFKSFGEFMYAVRFRPNDPRLEDLYKEPEQRQSSMGVGAEGGFMVPPQFGQTMFSVTPQEALFRPRCTVIPAGSPPDSEISFPALNQGAAQNMYGGVSVQWIGEGDTKPETNMRLKEIKWTPHEVAGHIIVTDKLLRNWGAADAVLSAQLRLAIVAAEETAFYSGNGVARPLGILSTPARIDVARAVANQIAYADVIGMFARLRRNMSPVWIASPTVIPQLTTMVDNATGSNAIWVPSAVPGMPATLMGIPVIFSERSVALGTRGDLVLADLSYYVIKDGSGPFVMASEHVYFTSNRTVIKIFWNVDGKPWMDEPLPLEGSTANTVSPFIVLN